MFIFKTLTYFFNGVISIKIYTYTFYNIIKRFNQSTLFILKGDKNYFIISFLIHNQKYVYGKKDIETKKGMITHFIFN